MSLGTEPHNQKCYIEMRRKRVWLRNDDASRLERHTTWRHCVMTKAGVAAVSDLEVLVSCSFARLDDWVNTKHAASSETTIEAKLPRSSTCFETATPTRTTPPPAPRVQLRREVEQKASKISVWNHILHRNDFGHIKASNQETNAWNQENVWCLIRKLLRVLNWRH